MILKFKLGLGMILFNAIIILMIAGCTNQEDCPRYVQVPAFITPKSIEYHIGDTITITSKFHKDVQTFNSEFKEIDLTDMSDLEWQPTTIISRIDTIGQSQITAVDKYFYFVENAEYNYHLFIESQDFSALDGSYNFHNDSFDLQIQLVPKKIGTYLLLQQCGANVLGKQRFPGRCPGENVDAWVKMNNGDSNNIQLLLQSPDSFWNTTFLYNPKANFYEDGGYCFKVVP